MPERVDIVAFTDYVKGCTLLHVHHRIDCVLHRFREHRCIARYARELMSIPEVSRDMILQRVDEMRRAMHDPCVGDALLS